MGRFLLRPLEGGSALGRASLRCDLGFALAAVNWLRFEALGLRARRLCRESGLLPLLSRRRIEGRLDVREHERNLRLEQTRRLHQPLIQLRLLALEQFRFRHVLLLLILRILDKEF